MFNQLVFDNIFFIHPVFSGHKKGFRKYVDRFIWIKSVLIKLVNTIVFKWGKLGLIHYKLWID